MINSSEDEAMLKPYYSDAFDHLKLLFLFNYDLINVIEFDHH